MPILAKDGGEIAPRSLVRHRPIFGKRGPTTTDTTPSVQRASRPPAVDTTDDVTEWTQAQSTEAPGIAGRFLRRFDLRRRAIARKSEKGSGHSLLYLGLGMLVMLALSLLLAPIVSWINVTLDDIQYGRPRTFQIDALVGHSEQNGIPSHFIAINHNRRIQIIEFPGGDSSKPKVYMGPQLYGENDELIPVTLRFVDVNHDRKPDMIVLFRESRFVYLNENGGFRLLQPSEQQKYERELEQI
ncbi:hypothetical protein EI42_02056 [Thermosporothrix hazakensis]|jgi:hypothetical protein|uniref:Uncharacterized protein n=2 Tax=Thermosporothrix TaxID=768650 RepID=A0A326UAR7_THEHA|nr:hypothetical protein [Thermosporothrix hazakensis]PZW32030.1 hypothetical protein EI42_02056 [Thermosporothrix hazakensis]BBH91497.1 hypothetical protein KTC_62480 [Thermosporothrix sp. COM3]GCE49642.1 hypothetical protein KTH_45110 [Thermosporothrix hazakensis]